MASTQKRMTDRDLLFVVADAAGGKLNGRTVAQKLLYFAGRKLDQPTGHRPQATGRTSTGPTAKTSMRHLSEGYSQRTSPRRSSESPTGAAVATRSSTRTRLRTGVETRRLVFPRRVGMRRVSSARRSRRSPRRCPASDRRRCRPLRRSTSLSKAGSPCSPSRTQATREGLGMAPRRAPARRSASSSSAVGSC
jgi:hypothetical protein